MLTDDVPHVTASTTLRDGDLALRLATVYRRADSPWKVPAYRFDMIAEGAQAGTVSLRIGNDERLIRYAGHAGYAVEPAWRGRHFAERALRLLLPLARAHGLDTLWITCTPDNRASRRTLERLDAEFVETVAVPSDYESYARGEREKCRYLLRLPASP